MHLPPKADPSASTQSITLSYLAVMNCIFIQTFKLFHVPPLPLHGCCTSTSIWRTMGHFFPMLMELIMHSLLPSWGCQLMRGRMWIPHFRALHWVLHRSTCPVTTMAKMIYRITLSQPLLLIRSCPQCMFNFPEIKLHEPCLLTMVMAILLQWNRLIICCCSKKTDWSSVYISNGLRSTPIPLTGLKIHHLIIDLQLHGNLLCNLTWLCMLYKSGNNSNICILDAPLNILILFYHPALCHAETTELSLWWHCTSGNQS